MIRWHAILFTALLAGCGGGFASGAGAAAEAPDWANTTPPPSGDAWYGVGVAVHITAAHLRRSTAEVGARADAVASLSARVERALDALGADGRRARGVFREIEVVGVEIVARYDAADARTTHALARVSRPRLEAQIRARADLDPALRDTLLQAIATAWDG